MNKNKIIKDKQKKDKIIKPRIKLEKMINQLNQILNQ